MSTTSYSRQDPPQRSLRPWRAKARKGGSHSGKSPAASVTGEPSRGMYAAVSTSHRTGGPEIPQESDGQQLYYDNTTVPDSSVYTSPDKKNVEVPPIVPSASSSSHLAGLAWIDSPPIPRKLGLVQTNDPYMTAAVRAQHSDEESSAVELVANDRSLVEDPSVCTISTRQAKSWTDRWWPKPGQTAASTAAISPVVKPQTPEPPAPLKYKGEKVRNRRDSSPELTVSVSSLEGTKSTSPPKTLTTALLQKHDKQAFRQVYRECKDKSADNLQDWKRQQEVNSWIRQRRKVRNDCFQHDMDRAERQGEHHNKSTPQSGSGSQKSLHPSEDSVRARSTRDASSNRSRNAVGDSGREFSSRNNQTHDHPDHDKVRGSRRNRLSSHSQADSDNRGRTFALLGRQDSDLKLFSLAPLNTMDHLPLPTEDKDPVKAVPASSGRSVWSLPFRNRKHQEARKLVQETLERERNEAQKKEEERQKEEIRERLRIARRKEEYLQRERHKQMTCKYETSDALTCSTVERTDNESTFLDQTHQLNASSYSTSNLPPCAICHTGARTHIATPCMHFSFCRACALQAKNTCPICARKVIFSEVQLDIDALSV